MKQELYFCDRCGKEITENYLNTRGFHIHWCRPILTTNDDGHLLLCQKCYDDLNNWWKKGKKKQ